MLLNGPKHILVDIFFRADVPEKNTICEQKKKYYNCLLNLKIFYDFSVKSLKNAEMSFIF